MKVVVLTGGIASGKSTVSNVLAGMGIPVIDADRVARDVVEPGEDAHREIVETFGREILREDGAIDRERLGRIVFSDGPLREKLERITHPRIGERMARLLAAHAAAGTQAVVLDIPLYVENLVRNRGVTIPAHAVIVVNVDEATQAARLIERDALSPEEARARISAQMPLREKVAHADHVIDNSGTREETARRVREVWSEIVG